MKWLLPNQFCDFATAYALGADQFCGVGTTWESDPETLKVWFEFSPSDSGYFRTNTAKVFLLTTDGHGVPHREPFSADFTATRHHTTFFL